MVCILYALTSLLSIYGNTLVMWIVTTTKALQNVNDLFIANLALSDVTIALFCIPFQSYAALVQRWDLPEFMCKFCPMAQMASINVSIFTLIAIAKERYRAVINPMGLQTSRFEARIYLALIWIFSVLFAIPVGLAHVFTYKPDKQLGAKPFCSPYETFQERKERPNFIFSSNQMKGYDLYMLLMFGVQYAFPFAYLTSKYAAMAHCLWKTNLAPGNPDEDRDENILAQRKRSVKMMITVVTMFGICWLPWHAFHCARLIWPKMMKYFELYQNIIVNTDFFILFRYEYINVVFFVSHWIAMSNSCLNPFIYAIFSVSRPVQDTFIKYLHSRYRYF